MIQYIGVIKKCLTTILIACINPLMTKLILSIGAYTVFFLWYPYVFTENYLQFTLSWAVSGALMSIFARKNPLPVIIFSLISLLMNLLSSLQPNPLWAIGAGIGTGSMIPYLLNSIQRIQLKNRVVGYGVGSGLIAITILAYLKPHTPEEYFQTLVSILPLSYLLLVPLLYSPAKETQREEVLYRWNSTSVMVFTVGLITGVYDRGIFPELFLGGEFHPLILFLSIAGGAFFMGHFAGEKGLKLHHSLFFILTIPLSLAIFGFKASLLTYTLSDLLIGFGLGSAAAFALQVIHNFNHTQRAISIALIGFGLILGGRFEILLERFYGIDMEGIAFISIFLFFAGIVPALLMMSSRRSAAEREKPEEIETVFERNEVAPQEEKAPLAPQPEVLQDRATIQNLSDEFGLSPRELEVLNLIAEGKTTHEIAKTLYISESTTKTHIRHIYEKTGVKNKVELINKIRV